MKGKKNIFLFLIISFSFFSLKGQTKDSIIIVHPLLGERIDATEKKIHNLFPNYTKFQFDYAEFHLFDDGAIVLFVTLKKTKQVDSIYYTDYQFQNLHDDIEKYYEIKIDDTLKTWEYPYMKWHYFIATRGKYKNNINYYKNLFFDQGYKGPTCLYKQDKSTPVFSGQPAVNNTSTLPLFGIDYNFSKRIQIGVEYTRATIDLECGKDTGYNKQITISVNQNIVGNLITSKINFKLIPHQNKKQRFECSTGIGIISNYIIMNETIKTFLNTGSTNSNNLLTLEENQYKKVSLGLHPFFRGDFFITKHLSILSRFEIPIDFGLTIPNRTSSWSGIKFILPKQNINFSGFKLNFGIALHFLEKNKIQTKPL